MLNRDLIKNLDFKDPSVWLATWFGCGLMRPAPGTWGTIGALPFGLLLMVAGGAPALLLGALIVTYVGLKVSARFEEMTGTHDNSAIVIDEVAGMWIALLPAALVPLHVLIAFALFRFFDILKPWPVGWADKKLPGARGVMMDDILAGIYAALILGGLRYAGFI